MCCFTAPVVGVELTGIFVRAAGSSQLLAYQMRYQADEALAMILPIPTPPGVAENAVRFIDLSGYEKFFADAESGFPLDAVQDPFEERTLSARARLEVLEVGSHEASFVPRVADFSRLDPRFRMPEGVWEKLPQYADWAFCVFKLKPGAQQVHPMAFEFPRRDAARLFFPTVHVHDGSVHAKAFFQHRLYCQREQAPAKWLTSHRVPEGWYSFQDADDRKRAPMRYEERKRLYQAQVDRVGPMPARAFMQVERALGLLQPDAPLYRHYLFGPLPNQDQVL